MLAKYLWVAGSIPFIVLGSIHLLYTFFTNKFNSRNSLLDEQMKTSHPVLTRQTTMWKAWTGFNASHASGAIYIGIVNLLLALSHFSVVQEPAFLILNVLTVLFYLWLARKFWFRIPFTGILLAACCFIAATVILLFN